MTEQKQGYHFLDALASLVLMHYSCGPDFSDQQKIWTPNTSIIHSAGNSDRADITYVADVADVANVVNLT